MDTVLRWFALLVLGIAVACEGPTSEIDTSPDTRLPRPPTRPRLVIDNATGNELTASLDGRAVHVPAWSCAVADLEPGPHELVIADPRFARAFTAVGPHMYVACPGATGRLVMWKELFGGSGFPHDNEERQLAGLDWHEVEEAITFAPGEKIPPGPPGRVEHRYCMRKCRPEPMPRAMAAAWLTPARRDQAEHVFGWTAYVEIVCAGIEAGITDARAPAQALLARPDPEAPMRYRLESALAVGATPEWKDCLEEYMSKRPRTANAPDDLIVALVRVGAHRAFASAVAKLPPFQREGVYQKLAALPFTATRTVALETLSGGGEDAKWALPLLLRDGLAADAEALERVIVHASAIDAPSVYDAVLIGQSAQATLAEPAGADRIAAALVRLPPEALHDLAHHAEVRLAHLWTALRQRCADAGPPYRKALLEVALKVTRKPAGRVLGDPIVRAALRDGDPSIRARALRALVAEPAALNDPELRAAAVDGLASGDVKLLESLVEVTLALETNRGAELVRLLPHCVAHDALARRVVSGLAKLREPERTDAFDAVRARWSEWPAGLASSLADAMAGGPPTLAASHAGWKRMLSLDPPELRLLAARRLHDAVPRFGALLEDLARAAQAESHPATAKAMQEMMRRAKASIDRDANKPPVPEPLGAAEHRALSKRLLAGDESARPGVYELLTTADVHVRVLAMQTLLRVPLPKDLDRIHGALEGANAAFKQQAIETAMVQHKAPRSLAILRTLAADPETRTRRFVYQALANHAAEHVSWKVALHELVAKETDTALAAQFRSAAGK